MVSVTLDPTCLAVTPGNTWQHLAIGRPHFWMEIHHDSSCNSSTICWVTFCWITRGSYRFMCQKRSTLWYGAHTQFVSPNQAECMESVFVDLYCLSLLTRPRLRPRLRLGRHWGGSMYRLNHQTAPVPKKCFQVTPFAPVKCPNHYTTGEATWKKIRTSMLAYNWTSQV